MQGRKPAGEHAPVRRSASGGHRDPAARDGEACRGAEHAFGKAPQAPAGAGHALQHGALDLHDLVAEAGEQQADLVACEGVDPLLALPDLLAPVVALAARSGRQGRGHDAHQLPQMALRLAAFAVQRQEVLAGHLPEGIEVSSQKQRGMSSSGRSTTTCTTRRERDHDPAR